MADHVPPKPRTEFKKPNPSRACPNYKNCKGIRRAGEIFCHGCYFRLPKELRDRLWARSLDGISLAIKDCKAYLNPSEPKS
jgi:hypothetical protein